MNAKDTAERIRGLRTAMRLSQAKFADVCGIEQGQLCNYELARIMPTIPLCERICRSNISRFIKGDVDATIRGLLALEDLTGKTFRELFGECEGRR